MLNESFIHREAIVENGVTLGGGTRVWAFAHILPGAVIGKDCNICDHVFIENEVSLGDRVTIKSGVQLWDGIRVEDDVFIGPNATFTNDPFPRSKQHLDEFPKTLIRNGASIGANATVLPGLVIGPNAMVGAGAVVTHDVPSNSIVTGNPARIIGYVDSHQHSFDDFGQDDIIGPSLQIDKAKLICFPLIEDLRGRLIFGEYAKHIPFEPRRYFLIHEVPSTRVRGEHAHKVQSQLLTCLQGTCTVVLDDGECRDEIVLNRPNIGLYVPPMIWATQYRYSSDAILLVFASDVYDPDDYIRDYDRFLDMLKSK